MVETPCPALRSGPRKGAAAAIAFDDGRKFLPGHLACSKLQAMVEGEAIVRKEVGG